MLRFATLVLTSAPMAKRDEDRGPVALWARRERLARNWTTHDVARRLGELGVAITEQSYRGYEAGPRVSAPVRKALEAIYNSAAPDPRAEVDAEPTDVSSLVAALQAQTQAISELVAVLREQRVGDDEPSVRAMVEALRHGARLVVEPPELPDGTHP
jgi:hypothetical protein